MKVIASIVFSLVCSQVSFGQAALNVLYTNGTAYMYLLSDYDSLTYSPAIDPTHLNFHSDGSSFQIDLAVVDSVTYSENGPAGSPLALTLYSSGITDTSAQLSGAWGVWVGGDLDVSPGFCWSDQPDPTISNDTAMVSHIGSFGFHGMISGLTPNTTYYVRAFASNQDGLSYGNQIVFHTSEPEPLAVIPGPGVTDNEGNFYPSVILNNGQEWMTENLRTTFYANGDPIDHLDQAAEWSMTDDGAWCHYENDIGIGAQDGNLYNGFAVLDSRNVCPSNWHVPTYQEILTLMDRLGGSLVAGGKMKDPFDWGEGGGSTNESGLTALPAGLRDQFGVFNVQGSLGSWWSSSFDDFYMNGFRVRLLAGQVESYLTRSAILGGYSVRCVKD